MISKTIFKSDKTELTLVNTKQTKFVHVYLLDAEGFVKNDFRIFDKELVQAIIDKYI